MNSVYSSMNECDCLVVDQKGMNDHQRIEEQGVAKSYCLWMDLHASMVSR
jgi:hypothetical protein